MRYTRRLDDFKRHFTAEERKGHRLHKVHLTISAAYVTLSPCTPGRTGWTLRTWNTPVQWCTWCHEKERPLICCIYVQGPFVPLLSLLNKLISLLFKIISPKSAVFFLDHVHILAWFRCVSMMHSHTWSICVPKVYTIISFLKEYNAYSWPCYCCPLGTEILQALI